VVSNLKGRVRIRQHGDNVSIEDILEETSDTDTEDPHRLDKSN
jgi:hypothetical protein